MTVNYVEMSDEEIMAELAKGAPAPEAVEPSDPAPVSVEPPVEEVQPEVIEPEVVAEPPVEEPTVEDVTPPVQEPQLDADGNPITEVINPANQEPVKPTTPSTPAAETPAPVDYEAAYKQIVGPLKANGKTIDIRSIEEAQRLMQMGAGFSRKMNELQPHLKTMRMLDKHGLRDADLSFLIDLHQKKPEAIRKLVQDSGLDPLAMDVETPVNYTPTDRSVSDNEIRFQQDIDEVKLHDSGQETINVVNRDWDEASVNSLLEVPGSLQTIHAQRLSGAYDQIVAEVERQRVLGKIPSGTSFIDAYSYMR